MSIKKIVVVGPESTGKSTLSEALATALNTVWVPEYAREYLESLDRPYTEDDQLLIAKGQVASEDRLIQQANNYLICDTDLYVLKVWGESKYGRVHRWILEEIARRKYDLYLLTNIDVPWQDDPLREHPTPEARLHFYNAYRDVVINSNTPWADISGNEQERLSKALQAIELLGH